MITCGHQRYSQHSPKILHSHFAAFVSPTLTFGTRKEGGMGEGVWSEEISQMLVCMNSFPFAAFLLNLASLASLFFLMLPPPKTNDFS